MGESSRRKSGKDSRSGSSGGDWLRDRSWAGRREGGRIDGGTGGHLVTADIGSRAAGAGRVTPVKWNHGEGEGGTAALIAQQRRKGYIWQKSM